ncbi:MAG: chitobiase/beta-hexosaminidase C-terminal domain-containing protein [Pirellulaceae bacterium]|nr:chitobiase/beta-hexosaminidase C-terminal domain-containing protein [Pirellulaceae bacterium]
MPLPQVLDGFRIELVAQEPLVHNPCAMAFDVRGRMCIGMGPQYRRPTPDTPGDSVWMVTDTNGDGQLDHKHQFASGFNCIQSIAWHGDDLWVANAPDLTLVRDTDGDNVADEYVRIYTDLGNLEHGLHGLNWGPDGRLYMSKGNSKGLTQPGRMAPAAFRELWGVTAPAGSPDIPAPKSFTAETYQRVYQDPADDWGAEGGVLVCDDMGENLEIISRGFRNPWDLAHDDQFNWQSTDNDQDDGDRVFMPFRGAHFGWGHPWSAHWTGRGHLPTAPITGPVFHGSGTGLTFYLADQFPVSYRGCWFFNDWLRKTTFMYRPEWEGALIQPKGGAWTEFVTGGDALYRPTDIEVGPDGGLYIFGWGKAYGVVWNEEQEQANEGRVFRVTWKGGSQDALSPLDWTRPLNEWSTEELVDGFASPIPARRVAAQLELLKRASSSHSLIEVVLQKINGTTKHVATPNRRIETWLVWTLGQMSHDGKELLPLTAGDNQNCRIQATRALGDGVRRGDFEIGLLVNTIVNGLDHSAARVRFAVLQTIHPAWWHVASNEEKLVVRKHLLAQASEETDRVCFYNIWQRMREVLPLSDRYLLLEDSRPGVRLAALLSLAEDRDVPEAGVEKMLADVDDRVREVAGLWIAKRGGNSLMSFSEPAGDFDGFLEIKIAPGIKPATMYYTTDGSTPTRNSPVWKGGLTVDRTMTLRVALYSRDQQIGPVAEMHYRLRSPVETSIRTGLLDIRAESDETYVAVYQGLVEGARVYSDRPYHFERIPKVLAGFTTIRCANNDSESRGQEFLRFESVVPITVYLGYDLRVSQRPNWLDGFMRTPLRIKTNDTEFEVYRRDYAAGVVTLGGNATVQANVGKSNYIVAIEQHGLQPKEDIVTVSAALSQLDEARPERGRALFFANGGATCSACHRADESGDGYGPDLLQLAKRRDPEHVVRSIIEPSAHITEGFYRQIIHTTAGTVVTGLLKEHTAAGITLVQPDGKTHFILSDDVDERLSDKKSAMPEFGSLLSAQQVADLTAWLIGRYDLEND